MVIRANLFSWFRIPSIEIHLSHIHKHPAWQSPTNPYHKCQCPSKKSRHSQPFVEASDWMVHTPHSVVMRIISVMKFMQLMSFTSAHALGVINICTDENKIPLSYQKWLRVLDWKRDLLDRCWVDSFLSINTNLSSHEMYACPTLACGDQLKIERRKGKLRWGMGLGQSK